MALVNAFLAGVSAPPIGQAAIWAATYDGRHGPLIDLSQAVPGHAPPAFLESALAQAAGDPAFARYGPVLGDGVLRQAYADESSRLYGTIIDSSEVAVTAGCNQAFFVSVMMLAKAGDAIVLPQPFYFNHQMSLAMLGIEVRGLETRAEDGFVPTVEALETVLDERVKAVALVSPNNPTGAIYPAGLIADYAAICKARNIALIVDETYRDFRPRQDLPPHGLFALPDWRDFVVQLYSFSKAYAVPGHRLGAMIAGKDLLAEAAKVIDCIQICAPRPAQRAVALAIERTRSWRDGKASEILGRTAAFRQALAPHIEKGGREKGWRIEQMGAYFAYVRHPFEGKSADIVAQALARDLGIVVLPGNFFGPGQERHLRMAFANISADRIETLGHRLSQAESLFHI